MSAAPVTDWRARLDCRFEAVEAVWPDCLAEAQGALSPEGLAAYVDQARWLGKLGRGPDPVLAFLEAWPTVAQLAGEDALPPVSALMQALQKSPNSRAIPLLLQSLPAVARRLRAAPLLGEYCTLVRELAERTAISIHGHHATEPSPGLPAFLAQAPTLVGMAPLQGLRRWVDAGIRLHGSHPQRQADYLGLQSADSRMLLQRERSGTLLMDVERQLELTLRSLWGDAALLVPYPVRDDALPMRPYLADDGMRLPEVLEPLAGVGALDRYRAMLTHLAAHRRWSQPQVADNLSPLQRLAVETFEDARVDALTLRRYPGLRRVLLALHPAPRPDACDTTVESGLRHRLALLSRALLDPGHPYTDAVLCETTSRFHALLAGRDASTGEVAALALAWAARTRVQSDQLARVYFTDTVVDWRDDNRHLWTFIEAGDEEEPFDDPKDARRQTLEGTLPPHRYPEWDEGAQTLRPDWSSVYDLLQPAGAAADVDALLARHAGVARHLQRTLDQLKPQDRTRLRQQAEGTELDLDVAVRALVDWRAGAQPDPRIHMSTRTDGRDIAVLLLVDLSQSVNDTVPSTEGQTVLSLSRAAVALLGWAVDALGDQLAIAGFHSNTRHEVRYLHIKGFAEPWGDAPKARLAGAQGAWSTRMGAALRHAGHLLSGRKADKRLLLVLTDGQPSDVDAPDAEYLLGDAAHAVRGLERQGLYTHCISLDPKADDYVSRIFGTRWTVVDHVEQLPRRLPELFVSLTR